MPPQAHRTTPPAAKPAATRNTARRADQPALLLAKLPAAAPKKRLSEAEGVGFGISVVAHVFVLLLLGFTVPEGGARKEKPHLDVVIVNAKHSHAPRTAQALAQANMEGGGNVDTKDLPTTPLPPELADLNGDAMVDASKRVESLEARQRTLLAQARSLANIELAAGHRTIEQTPSDAPKPGDAAEEKARAMAKQEAIVDRHQREYAARPRKTVITPNTLASGFALYTIAWRKVVEDLGSLKFPKGADGKAIYGSVQLAIEIDRKGGLVSATVSRPSGNKRLDEAAVRIVRMASPFKPLPLETARDTDILVMVETFRFQQILGDSSLEVKNSAQ